MSRRPLVPGLVAFAIAACAQAASAQGSTASLYGLIDASGSRVRPVGVDDKRWQLDSGNMSRSYIGFRASEDLGGGLRAVFKLESYVRVDTGNAGRAAGAPFWDREANVGLSGQFGTTVFGRNVTPLYDATTIFNPFGDSPAFSPSRRHYYDGDFAVASDRSWRNSVAYTNNPRDALRIRFAANLPEDSGPGRNFGASFAYVVGPFAATIAAERVKNSEIGQPAGFKRQFTIQGGASYDFSFARLYAQLGHAKTDADLNRRTTVYQLGAAVPIGTSLILVSYGHAKTRIATGDVTDRIASIGYDYFLSKNTDIYAAASYERVSNLSSGHTLAGGVRLRF